MKAEKIPYITDNKKYVEVARAADGDELDSSVSGKALKIDYGQSAFRGGTQISRKSFWVPVSICRRQEAGNYGAKLMVPVWFLAKEGHLYDF